MKKIRIEIIDKYKSYEKDTIYNLDGDLIVLSGINGSGKSQLLRIISKSGEEPINRKITQTDENEKEVPLESVLLFSFRDNIDLGKDFGQFSVTYKETYATNAWQFYNDNIKHKNNKYMNEMKTKKFVEGTLIFNDSGIKNPSWRSIIKLTELIKNNYIEEKIFNLTQEEIESILPPDFIWRNENDIIEQVGNLFYVAADE